MQIGLYIAGFLLVLFITIEFGGRLLDRLVSLSATVSEYRGYVRLFVRAGYPGVNLHFKHKETGRAIKLKKLHLPFDWKGELTVGVTVVIPPSYRLEQMENICDILKKYDPTAGMTRPGELLAHFPNDEELLSSVVRSILSEGLGLSFGAQLKILQFGPQSIRELAKCGKL
jgi:hypothetical protein